MKKENIKQFLIKMLKKTSNLTWIFFLIISIYSFKFKLVIPTTLGITMLCQSFVFFPWIDNITLKYKFKLSFINKLIIFITTFLASSYALKINNESYIITIVALFLDIFIWFLTILYAIKHKNKKSLMK